MYSTYGGVRACIPVTLLAAVNRQRTRPDTPDLLPSEQLLCAYADRRHP